MHKNPQRIAQINANAVSYAWDGLIEKFSHNLLGGTEYFASGLAIRDQERILRFMARENRTRRRLLAQALLDILSKTASDNRAARMVQPSFPGDPFYVFLLLPWPPEMEEEVYRTARYNLLSAYCEAVKVIRPEAQDIIGIATESGTSEHRSEDALYLDASHWTEEYQKGAEEIRERLSLFKEVRKSSTRVDEYPAQVKVFRNSKCPCGSRKKYKQCCGRDAENKKRH